MIPEDRNLLRLVSYNVHACIGRDGRFMPERILSILERLDADLVALQEIEDRPHNGLTVSDFFSERLQVHAYCGPTLRRGNAAYGNLLLAKQAAAAIRAHDISVPGVEPRGAIEADFMIGERRLKLITTHLGLRAQERRAQVSQLLANIDHDAADISVLAGDFNEWRPGSFLTRALKRVFGPGSSARTFPSAMPLLALDRFYVAPRAMIANLKAVTSAECRQASDHVPLVCDLSLHT